MSKKENFLPIIIFCICVAAMTMITKFDCLRTFFYALGRLSTVLSCATVITIFTRPTSEEE